MTVDYEADPDNRVLDMAKVERVLELLLDDRDRQGGRLQYDQVLRTIDRRGLCAAESAEVWRRLPPVDGGPHPEDVGWHPAAGETRPVRIGHDTSEVDTIKLYLSEIGRHPLLTPEEEVLLARRVRAGEVAREGLRRGDIGVQERQGLRRQVEDGDAARAHLVNANLRLVVSIARRYHRRRPSLGLLDLVQEGNLGLMHAIEKFDHRKGFKLSTYATWWIKQAISRSVANGGRTVRLPVHVLEKVHVVRAAERELAATLHREPTLAELAERTGYQAARVQFLLDVSREPVSLDVPIGEDDDGDTLGDQIADPFAEEPVDIVMRHVLTDVVADVLDRLPDRQRRILRLRFGIDTQEGQTLEEIGAQFSVTRERIRQIEKKALTALRESRRSEVLREFYDGPTGDLGSKRTDEKIAG